MQQMQSGYMNQNGNGFPGGYGIWAIVGVLLAIFLVVGIVRMVQKK